MLLPWLITLKCYDLFIWGLEEKSFWSDLARLGTEWWSHPHVWNCLQMASMEVELNLHTSLAFMKPIFRHGDILFYCFYSSWFLLWPKNSSPSCFVLNCKWAITSGCVTFVSYSQNKRNIEKDRVCPGCFQNSTLAIFIFFSCCSFFHGISLSRVVVMWFSQMRFSFPNYVVLYLWLFH